MGKQLHICNCGKPKQNLPVFSIGAGIKFLRSYSEEIVQFHSLKASCHPCVLWQWLPPYLLLNWVEICLCISYTFATILILVLTAALGKDYEWQWALTRRSRGPHNPIHWSNLFFKGNIFPWQQEKVLWNLYEEIILKLHSKSTADIPKFHVIPGKLRDSPVHLGFTGNLTSPFAKPGSSEATMKKTPFSLLRTG